MVKIKEIMDKGLLAKTEELDLKKNHGYYIKIGIVSETISFLISRNNEATELTSENFLDDERAMIPAQKWRAAERSYLLSELRRLEGIIPNGYVRNMNKIRSNLKNPTSLLYGDTSIGSGVDMGSIASRCFYDWAYSFEPLGQISTRLVHNTLAEDGTILHSEAGKTESNAIYNIPYIKPGVKFVRFVTLENCSIELLKLEILAIVGCTRYGARTAILGDNINNKILSIGFSKGDKPISSYGLLEEAWKSNNYEPEKMVDSAMLDSYSAEYVLRDKDLEEFIKDTLGLVRDKVALKSMCELINTKMENDWSEFWK